MTIMRKDVAKFLRSKMAETLDLSDYELLEYAALELETPEDVDAGAIIVGLALRLRDTERMLVTVIDERDAIVAEISKAANS